MRDLYIALEPMSHMFFVIESAARHGVDVLAVHTMPISETPPCGDTGGWITSRLQIDDWKDPDAVSAQIIDAVGDRRVVGTYAAAELILTVDARVRRHFNLPYNDPTMLGRLLNKQQTRERLRASNLSRLSVINEKEARAMAECGAALDAVYFFKPTSGAGSAYVRRCETADDLRDAIAAWDARTSIEVKLLNDYLASGTGFFLEEAASGEILSAEGFFIDGAYRFFGLISRTLLSVDEVVEMGGSFPYRHPAEQAIAQTAEAIHHAVGFTHGPTHLEFAVTEGGDHELVEFNARFAGLDALPLINVATQKRVNDLIFAVSCGDKDASFHEYKAVRAAVAQYVLPPPGAMQFGDLEFPDGVDYQRLLKVPGADLRSTGQQMDHIASFIVSASSMPAAMDKMRAVRRDIKFNGVALGENDHNIVTAPNF
ncbi:MAG: ATP-grasp domain-containing protein [Pseudomonadota bacterium]